MTVMIRFSNNRVSEILCDYGGVTESWHADVATMYQDVITVLTLVGGYVNQVQQERVKVTVADNRVGSNDQLSGSFVVAIRA